MILHSLVVWAAAGGAVVVSARSNGMLSEDLLADLFPLQAGGCSYQVLLHAVASKCNCDPVPALLSMLPRLATEEDLQSYVGVACGTAWAAVETSAWQDVNFQWDDNFLQSFVEGDTFLNRETGNLREDEVENYPTSPSSRAAATAIDSFYRGRLQRSILESFSALDNCRHQSMMCCWGRDRQSNDNNGNCAPDNCDDASPADNSNLCMHEEESEGDIHCHGFAWSNDPNEASSIFKFNTFFYVSFYDHLYKRGYVENSLGGTHSSTGFPMCGCIEEMPLVSRADCTEVDPDITFVIDWEDGELVVETGSLTGLDFNSCNGYVFGNPNKKANNDLASHVNKLVSRGHVDLSTQMTMFDVLVGFFDPDNNESEDACSLAQLRHQIVGSSIGTRAALPVVSGKPTVELVVSASLCCVIVLLGVAATKWPNFRKLLNL